MAEKTSDEAGFKLKSCLNPKSVFSLTIMWLLRQETVFQQRATGALMEEKNYFKSSLKG